MWGQNTNLNISSPEGRKTASRNDPAGQIASDGKLLDKYSEVTASQIFFSFQTLHLLFSSRRAIFLFFCWSTHKKATTRQPNMVYFNGYTCSLSLLPGATVCHEKSKKEEVGEKHQFHKQLWWCVMCCQAPANDERCVGVSAEGGRASIGVRGCGHIEAPTFIRPGEARSCHRPRWNLQGVGFIGRQPIISWGETRKEEPEGASQNSLVPSRLPAINSSELSIQQADGPVGM